MIISSRKVPFRWRDDRSASGGWSRRWFFALLDARGVVFGGLASEWARTVLRHPDCSASAAGFVSKCNVPSDDVLRTVKVVQQVIKWKNESAVGKRRAGSGSGACLYDDNEEPCDYSRCPLEESLQRNLTVDVDSDDSRCGAAARVKFKKSSWPTVTDCAPVRFVLICCAYELFPENGWDPSDLCYLLLKIVGSVLYIYLRV